jgi:hypothetical protein
VIDTRSAWIGEHEVVEVRYRPDVTPYAELLEAAIAHGCADRVWTTTDAQRELASKHAKLTGKVAAFGGVTRPAKESDQLYYLERSPYAHLPLTPLQARRVNGALYLKTEPDRFLSPRQRGLLGAIRARLRSSPDGLEGLERPTTIDGLAAYEAELRALLRPTPRRR